MSKILKLVISVLICQLAGMVGSVFTSPAIPGWYANLIKPFFNPPNWLFGPVWLVLYILMAIGVYLVWLKIKEVPKAKSAFALFFVHLALNALWSPVFFGLRNVGLAFALIVLIWLLIIVLIIKFAQIDKRASWLLVPYLAWVSFASLLNYFIWRLN